MITDVVILIGPCRAGKSTIADLLAQRLHKEHVSLDKVGYGFASEIYVQGDNDIFNSLMNSGKYKEYYDMLRTYELHIVKRALETYSDCVMDFGAGHSVYDIPEQLEEVKRLLRDYAYVFLLLPDPDIDTSLKILNSRTDFPLHLATNEFMLRHCSNHELAKYTVYTEGHTPEETTTTILEIIDRAKK